MQLYVPYYIWEVIRDKFTEEEKQLLIQAKLGYVDRGVVVGSERLPLELGIKLAQALITGKDELLKSPPVRKLAYRGK